MKKLLVAFLAVVLVACSSSTGPEEEERQFEPYEVGSFLMMSPTKGVWQGDDAKKKDPTLITQPGDQHLELISDEDLREAGYFYMIFIDSTVTSDSIRYSEMTTNGDSFTSVSVSWTSNDDRLKLSVHAQYHPCTAVAPDEHTLNDTVSIEIFRKDSTSLRSWQINAVGMDGVIENITC